MYIIAVFRCAWYNRGAQCMIRLIDKCSALKLRHQGQLPIYDACSLPPASLASLPDSILP